MITRWKIFNFKSIRNETELELGPLTIFAGANSSGKSTFIQSVLLVAQTLANKVGSRSVVLNGALTSLGQFDDLKSTDSESDQISLKFTCRPITAPDAVAGARTSRYAMHHGMGFARLREIACEMSFDADPSNAQRELFQIQPRLFATQLSCLLRDADNTDRTTSMSVLHSTQSVSEIERAVNVGEIDDQFRAALAYTVELDDDSMTEMKEEYRSAMPVGCVLQHFLPERIVCAIDPIEKNAYAITRALQNIRHGKGMEFYFTPDIIAVLRDVLKGKIDDAKFNRVFKEGNRQETIIDSESDASLTRPWFEWLSSSTSDVLLQARQALRVCDDLFDRIYEAMKSSEARKRESHDFMPNRLRANKLPHVIAEAANYLNDYFASSVKYLGPLRDAPKPLYPLAPTADPYDVGLRGEHTASILELHKNKQIRYIPSAHFKNPVVDRKKITRTLEAAVIDWLQYLGVAGSVESKDKGKLGYELKVRLSDADSAHDLTHVGVGVSQVLPILVMCLLADEDSTLVFEQPELHLHPKVQTLLGDFFLSMALCNKQCIVETHSEYFIDRLRFRIAAASPGQELNDQAKIYFVEKPSQGSVFREVVINEYGAISDWPEGFFDQSQQQAEEILRAAAMKRKASRRNKDA